MQLRERKIVILNLLTKGPVREQGLEFASIHFSFSEHCVGWDFEAAEAIIRIYDGYADGYSLVGVPKHLGIGEHQVSHPGYLRLIRAATKTPVYVADELRDYFAIHRIERLLREQPLFFQNKKVLFQCLLSSPIVSLVVRAGGIVYSADTLFVSRRALRLRGELASKLLFKAIQPFLGTILFRMSSPTEENTQRTFHLLKNWMNECDVFVGCADLMGKGIDFTPLRGKPIIMDYVDPSIREQMQKKEVGQIIDFAPTVSGMSTCHLNRFPVLAAMIDQCRVFEQSKLGFPEYTKSWLERYKMYPGQLGEVVGGKRKCAVILPIRPKEVIRKSLKSKIQNELFSLASISSAPQYLGKLCGVVSPKTGQEMDCEFYGLVACPEQAADSKEEQFYKKLLQCIQYARSKGASLAGLGPIVQEVGDAGETIAKRAPIPVTNGNSYAAATTLWAARHVIEKLNLISPEKVGNKYQAHAMVIGATGSAGRVCAQLMSLVFSEITLISNRMDQLVELRDEILRSSPQIKVFLNTGDNVDLTRVDLIVLSTSHRSWFQLDMEEVKPGAVICDCSFPSQIGKSEAEKREDVLVIESAGVQFSGKPSLDFDIGLPNGAIPAAAAEAILLTLEGRYENFSVSKQPSFQQTKDIYKLGVKHGVTLSTIQGPLGIVTDAQIEKVKQLALESLPSWRQGSKSDFTNLTRPLTSSFTEAYESHLL